MVAETHSSLLLRRVQARVAQGRLAPERVRLHWFQRDREGVTRVTPAALDEDGAFGTWPEDFAQVEADEDLRYIEAVEARSSAARG